MPKIKASSIAAILLTACVSACMNEVSTESETLSTITLQELKPGICVQVLFESKNKGYTGDGYINSPNSPAARIEWSVSSPNGGDYTLTFRYANGAVEARSGELTLNDNIQSRHHVPLPSSGGWDQWATSSETVKLKKGKNSLVLRTIEDNGLANIDSLTITGHKPSAASCKQATPMLPKSTQTNFNYLNKPAIGWVTQGDGISGGGDLAPITVDNFTDLQFHAGDETPKVIHVKGKLEGTLHVGSNKTLIGLANTQIKGNEGALRISNSQNVIIKNIEFLGVHGHAKQNTVLHNAKNIWLDHNSFIDGSPNLIEVSGTSNFITLSWNRFEQSLHGHEHMGVNIGRSDADQESTGLMKVTLHHNLYHGFINERMPRVRFGQVHTFNNLCYSTTDELTRSYYAVRAGFDANIRSERNIYKNFIGPSWWWTSEKLGAENSTVFNYARGNEASVLESIGDLCVPGCVKGPIAIREHQGVTGQAGFYGTGKAFNPPYQYNAEPTENLESVILESAGAR
jgi:pectate lyase